MYDESVCVFAIIKHVLKLITKLKYEWLLLRVEQEQYEYENHAINVVYSPGTQKPSLNESVTNFIGTIWRANTKLPVKSASHCQLICMLNNVYETAQYPSVQSVPIKLNLQSTLIKLVTQAAQRVTKHYWVYVKNALINTNINRLKSVHVLCARVYVCARR